MYKALSVLVVALVVRLAWSWDIAVTARDRIEFYTSDGTKKDTVHFNSHNLTALTYDEVHNMLLYVDKQSDKGGDVICGYKISFVEYQCYIERNGRSIHGLAFDPVTETVFFTDTKERSINSFSFKSGSKNNVHGNLLIQMNEGIPTDIVVDSCRGYVYWINTNITPSTIERARYDGSEREVIIKATYHWDLQSLAIDQQVQKIYWKMPDGESSNYIHAADLNGKNRAAIISQIYYHEDHQNAFAESEHYLFSVSSCTSCSLRTIYQFPKPLTAHSYKELCNVNTDGVIGIATNYKIRNQLQEISECSHIVLNNYRDNDSSKIAREYEGPFCINGIRDNGQSLCNCTPGYTGVRCEASVCENYCIQGNCSLTEEGFPKCSCYADYSGERCEVNVCNGYCLNNGTCSLTEELEPICECTGEYEGGRCEIPASLNDVNGSLTKTIVPVCETRGPRLEDSPKNSIASSTGPYSVIRNFTLADLLANWQKPAPKISVVVNVN